MNKRQDYIVLGIALLATFLPMLLIEYRVLSFTNGIFIYPIDDTFIHMQVARNVAAHGNWGITATEFGSASSSIFYTVLLSLLFAVFSSNIFIPLIVNCIAGIILLYLIQKRLKNYGIGAAGQLIILLLIIFLTPLPILIMSGMEHTLQCLFVFLFVFGISDWLERTKENKILKTSLPWKIFLYGMMVAGLRYEGILLVGVVCLLLLFNRKIVTAFKLGFISLLPLIIFGIYSIAKGSYFIPNSVLVKSEPIPFSLSGILNFINDTLVYKLTSSRAATTPPFARPGITLLATQRLLIILPLAYLLFMKYIRERRSFGYALIILTSCTVLHLSFAATGWFYRYEAYLILCSVFVLGVLTHKWLAEIKLKGQFEARLVGLILLFALFFPLLLRTSAAFSKAHQASINIFEQQYQMGQFLNTYYNTDTVAANDVGAISYLTNTKVIDLWGLGNIDVAKSRKGNYWTPVFLDSLSRQHHAKLAIVYDSWFTPELLKKWQKLATWQIPNNVICGDDIVSFYAIDTTIVSSLKKNLEAYQHRLPADVKVVYY